MWLLKALQSIRTSAEAETGTIQSIASMHLMLVLRIDRRNRIVVIGWVKLNEKAFNRRERRETPQRTQRNPRATAARKNPQRTPACQRSTRIAELAPGRDVLHET